VNGTMEKDPEGSVSYQGTTRYQPT